MSIVEIDRSLLLATGMFVAAALVALRWAEANARRIATDRARFVLAPTPAKERARAGD